MQPIWHPSPNFGPRRDDARPELIVLHYTAMGSATGARDWLCNPDAEVSAHYVVAPDGTIWQLVIEAMRAWHAGAGEWQGRADVNSRSIGIEICNTGSTPFANPQMEAVEALLRGIMKRWNIPPEGVIGHSDMAPGRKIDPGPRFDWARLAKSGLARATPAGVAPQTRDFEALAHAAGYTAAAPIEVKLKSLRDRHAPWRKGPICDDDLRLLAALAL